MSDASASPDRPARTRRTALLVVSCLVAGATAAGLWLLIPRSDNGSPDCAGLMEQQRMRTALGAAAPEGDDCAELGAAIVRVTKGSEAGRHTPKQARAMKNVLLAVGTGTGRGDGTVPEGLRRHLGEAMEGYAHDLYEILHGLNPAYVNTAAPAKSPWQDDSGAHFSVPSATALTAMSAASGDPAVYTSLRTSLDDEGVQRFASLPDSATGEAPSAVAASDARVTGALAGVAAHVAESRGKDSDAWYRDVFTALLKGNVRTPAAETDLAGHLTGTWKAQLRSTAPEDRPGLLRERSGTLFSRWADLRALPAAEQDSTLLNCRNNARGAYGDAVEELGG
ncbi:hypothetical protein OG413_00745 [Streptomyces sp. NBC_01433]|uniref:hypothetical protein n=1 Tax=Streptomyces sp. NBC_01433 TaxID=2903864 RepID=UPI00225AE09C|nr:hypothetical protein [Streptomyces sp. NBC_01433]MCX4673863.1 hypothetical protein [Streptomyces sp. NBC_01433]